MRVDGASCLIGALYPVPFDWPSLYVSGPSFESISAFRYQMSVRFLRVIGALPDAPR